MMHSLVEGPEGEVVEEVGEEEEVVVVDAESKFFYDCYINSINYHLLIYC